MIGWLSGLVVQKTPPYLVLDVNGVGYAVETTLTTFGGLPSEGVRAELFIHTHVREDALTLFGFATMDEKRWFLELIKINGVGAKMALNLLSGLSIPELVDCIQSQNSKQLCTLPGIGKKTAERLLLELKDRLNNVPIDPANRSSSAAASASVQVLAALESLGFKPAEAERMLKRVPESERMKAPDVSDLVRLALKHQ